MSKLRVHFTIVILCCFSFLLMTGTHVLRKAEADFEAYRNPVRETGDKKKGRLEKVKESEKPGSPEEAGSAFKNGRIK